MSVRRLFRGERGASAVIIAGSLVLLMGVAAVALDGGQVFSERRQAQTGVDFAAMAALQSATSCPSPCTTAAAANAGATEAIAVVAENLPGRVLNWATCTDPTRPAKFTIVSTTSPCVSFTANLDESRVVLPPDTLDTSFAGVIGRDTVEVGAFAEAGQDVDATSAIVPFAFGGGTQTCLFSNQAPQTVPPCDGPNDGNFGYLDIFHYGNDTLGTTTNCSNASLSRLASNIALGSDHLLAIKGASDPVVNDRLACPNRSETPNQLEVQTGTPVQELTNGLVRSTTLPARLRCTAGSCRTVRGASLNNTPLWSYLTGSSCPGVTNRTQMKACLDSWIPGTGVIFSAAIADNKRFAAVPRFTSYPSTGFGVYNIVDFEPVYLDTIYAKCNANSCDTVFSPGAPASPPACPNPLDPLVDNCGFSGNWTGGNTIEGLTAFAIKKGMLPTSVTDHFPGSQGLRTFNLTE
ncbi:MAG: pilus assembly protein TadG-related protein [Acidimicrobiia bacterium]|nr:pilus assembly protein TadG-related protein [Acidimicrobiia bacterium]